MLYLTALFCLWSLFSTTPATAQQWPPASSRLPDPAPEPPAVRQWDTVDITAYGAVPNDGQDDTQAIRDAAEAVNNAGGGTVYTPPGIFEVRHLRLTPTPDSDQGAPPLSKPLTDVSFVGAGADQSIWRRRPYPNPRIDQRRLMTVALAQRVWFGDMAFDMHGLLKFGGAGFVSCQQCTIMSTRWYDSNPQLPEGDYSDRYALVFGFGGDVHRDIRLVDNTFEGLQVEVDHVDGALIADNTSINPVGTACFGTFALQSARVVRNVTYARNTCVNPPKSGFAVNMDFRPTETFTNNLIEDISLLGNQVVYDTGAAPGNAFRFGVGNNSIPTTGNVYRNLRIEGNHITLSPETPVSRTALIFGNTSGTANVHFKGITVRHNRLYSAAPRKFLELKQTQASTVTEHDNLRIACPDCPTDGETGPLIITQATASADDGHSPAQAIDGDLSTRWSALGKGQWLQLDLGGVHEVSAVRLAWYVGRSRMAVFALQVSTNGTAWGEVFSGKSGGSTDALEAFPFSSPVQARYVRYVGQGNTKNLWNSVTEVEVVGQ